MKLISSATFFHETEIERQTGRGRETDRQMQRDWQRQTHAQTERYIIIEEDRQTQTGCYGTQCSFSRINSLIIILKIYVALHSATYSEALYYEPSHLLESIKLSLTDFSALLSSYCLYLTILWFSIVQVFQYYTKRLPGDDWRPFCHHQSSWQHRWRQLWLGKNSLLRRQGRPLEKVFQFCQ